eukprot:944683-Alexandrium_andersonii.AAC.1
MGCRLPARTFLRLMVDGTVCLPWPPSRQHPAHGRGPQPLRFSRVSRTVLGIHADFYVLSQMGARLPVSPCQ